MLAHVAYDFEQGLRDGHNKKLHYKFLRDCLAEHVIPVSLLPRRLRDMSDEPFGQLQRVVLKYHVDKTKRETKEAFNFNIFKSNRF